MGGFGYYWSRAWMGGAKCKRERLVAIVACGRGGGDGMRMHLPNGTQGSRVDRRAQGID